MNSKLSGCAQLHGEFGVYERLPEQVEREDGVWDKLSQEMKQEVLVSTGNSRDEVFLEHSDCPLS